MIRLGYTQELDKAAMPNAANILPNLANVDFDPGRKHSLTWQSGFAGLAWDKEKVPAACTRSSDLWKPELAGRVEVLSEMRDTMGLIMLNQGVDPSGDWTDDDFYSALDVLKEKIDSGHIRQVPRQLLHAGPGLGRRDRRHRLVGRHHVAQLRGRRQVRVRHPGRRRHALERQHDGAGRLARTWPTPRSS